MKAILVIIALLTCLPSLAQMGEVSLAEDARALLALKQNAAGFGKKEVCEMVQPPMPKGSKPAAQMPPKVRVCKTVDWFNVSLAVKRGSEPMKVIRVDGDTCVSTVEAFKTVCYINHLGMTNGMNTEFAVRSPAGYKVYAIRRWIWSDRGGKHEEVYSPYNDVFNTAPMRELGQGYIYRLLEAAKADLRAKGVRSNARPAELVADVIPTRTIARLAVIEHVDHVRFYLEGIAQPAKEALVTYALNRDLAYRFSRSSADARGLLQYTRRTYSSIVGRYPSAGLIEDFTEAVKDSRNMAKAALLLADSDLSHVPLTLREKLFKDPDLLDDFVASAYNGGVARPRRLLEKGLDLARHNRNQENKTYVEKMRALRKAKMYW